MLRKTTYTILAVAFTASACGGTAETPKHQAKATQEQTTKQELAQLAEELAHTSLADALEQRDHFGPLCDSDGYPLPGNINNKDAGTTVEEFCKAIAAPTQQPTPAPTPTCDHNALNEELSNTPIENAITEHTHFRCLCDDAGYPLVGNINGKGATASTFCKALLEKGLL
jgi:hypothetical protein